jgi:hypothetical protein
MGEVIDLETWRQQRQTKEPGRPRRRRTPGGRGFDEDPTRYLSSGLPLPETGGNDDDAH